MQLEVATAIHTVAKFGAAAFVGVPVLAQVIGLKDIDQSLLVQPLFWVGLTVLVLLALSSRIVIWKLNRSDTAQLTQDSHTNMAFATKDDVILQLRAEQAAKDAEIARINRAAEEKTQERIDSLHKELDAVIKRAERLEHERDVYFRQAALLTAQLKSYHLPPPEFTHSHLVTADEASSITTTLDEESESSSILEEISEDLL